VLAWLSVWSELRILVDIRDGDFQGGKYPGMLLCGYGMTPCIFDDVQAPLPQHYTVGLPACRRTNTGVIRWRRFVIQATLTYL